MYCFEVYSSCRDTTFYGVTGTMATSTTVATMGFGGHLLLMVIMHGNAISGILTHK